MKKIFYTISGLVLIIALGILLNLQFDGNSGSDYLGHISASKGIINNYKEITFFQYPLASDTIVALLSLITSLSVIQSFIVYHIFIIIVVCLSFYTLGQKYNQGLLFSFLAVTYFNFSMWAGLSYPYPATLLFVLFPLVCKSVLEKDKLKTSILLLITLVLYWYGFLIFVAFIILYLMLNKIKNSYLLLLLIAISLLLFKLFLFKTTLGYSFLNPVSEDSFALYKSQIYVLILFFSFSIPCILIAKNDFEKTGLSLILLFAFIFLTFAYPFVIRSTFILFFGLYISVISYFKSSTNKSLKIILVFLLVLLLLPFVYTSNKDLLSVKNYNTPEENMLEWLGSSYTPGFEVISDPTTVKISKTVGARGYSYSYAQNDLENRPEIQHPSAVTSFLLNENFSKNDKDFIQFVKNEISSGYKNINVDTSPALVIISNRTTYWLKYLTPESSATFPSNFYDFNGLKKFNDLCYFKEVYNKDNIYIYEYQNDASSCN